MRYSVVPAILTATLDELKEQVKLVAAVSDLVQIDYADGYFVPEVTCCEAPVIRSSDLDISYEVHLMVEEPIDHVKGWVNAGAERIIGHIEEMSDQQAFVEKVSRYGVEVGLALKLETPLKQLKESIIPSLDLVLLMAHEVGVQGSGFDESVLDKIQQLRAAYPQVAISIDGGIDENTLLKAKEAGATIFVAGSSIFGDNDPVAAYKKLQALL